MHSLPTTVHQHMCTMTSPPHCCNRIENAPIASSIYRFSFEDDSFRTVSSCSGAPDGFGCLFERFAFAVHRLIFFGRHWGGPFPHVHFTSPIAYQFPILLMALILEDNHLVRGRDPLLHPLVPHPLPPLHPLHSPWITTTPTRSNRSRLLPSSHST